MTTTLSSSFFMGPSWLVIPGLEPGRRRTLQETLPLVP
jgi:hypothetical protein